MSRRPGIGSARRSGFRGFGGGAAAVVVAPPVNSVAPVASGTVSIGGSLSCTTGTWSGSPTYAYQWRRAGVNISPNGTSSTYTPVAADIGPVIDCVVTATNDGGSADADSNNLAYDTATALGSKLTVLLDEREQDGSPIDVWQNQDASVADFTAATTARPATGRTIGGQPAPDFDGTTDVLSSTSTLTDMISPATPAFHVQLVANIDAGGTNAVFSSTANNDQIICNAAGFFGVSVRNNGGAVEFHCWIFSTVYDGVTLTGYTLGTSVLIDFWASGGTISARLAAGSAQTDASVAAIPAGVGRNGPIKLMSSYNATQFTDGAIARVMVANAALSASEQADERAYCAWKYGVTV